MEVQLGSGDEVTIIGFRCIKSVPYLQTQSSRFGNKAFVPFEVFNDFATFQ